MVPLYKKIGVVVLAIFTVLVIAGSVSTAGESTAVSVLVVTLGLSVLGVAIGRQWWTKIFFTFTSLSLVIFAVVFLFKLFGISVGYLALLLIMKLPIFFGVAAVLLLVHHVISRRR